MKLRQRIEVLEGRVKDRTDEGGDDIDRLLDALLALFDEATGPNPSPETLAKFEEIETIMRFAGVKAIIQRLAQETV